jgi:UMF1 family MFS transporter
VVAATGQTRLAVLAVLGFFVAGAAVLGRVDVAAGERAARAAESGTPFAGAAPPLAGRA